MALIRFNLDLAIPEATFNTIPKAQKTAFKDAVQAMKALAVKINEGTANEEMTVRAVWHRCHHDIGAQPCEPEQEIQEVTDGVIF